ncbi:MAG: hypothetical protein FWC00_06495 [Firmicutes bacterium]|nr:hypothetical protein [Bacillota bacterium]
MFKRIKENFNRWVKGHPSRKPMVWIIGIAVFVMFFSSLDPSGFVGIAGMVLLIAALSLSISDTTSTFKKFNLDLKTVVERHRQRQMEYYGQVTESCFTPEDIKDIRRRRTQYKVWIAFKILIIIILIVAMVNVLT